jgi:hypothetical protein
MPEIKKKPIPRCDCCLTVKNPRFALIDIKTQEVSKKLCRNCASNVDKIFELLKNPRGHEIGSSGLFNDPEDEIPF